MKIKTCSAAVGFVFACAAIAIAPAPARAQATETVLHSFGNQIPKGGKPQSALIRDAAGNLYGTAYDGGRYGAGLVFKLDTTGRETVLHNFTGHGNGAGPNNVIRDSAGNLYGTTQSGGVPGCYSSCGVVFKLDPAGKYSVLYSFTDQADGGIPSSGVIRDSAGNLYGTTSYKATIPYDCPACGMVYKLDPAGQLTVLYSPTSTADGPCPRGVVNCSGVIMDSAGNLYGTTSGGGAANAGVVYKLDPAGQETNLYTFTGLGDGKWPTGVIRDSAGNLYGTTVNGGAAGSGVVYKLDTAGHQTVLYSFTGGVDGGEPYAGVIGDGAGNLYGTTLGGGGVGLGVVYELDATGQEEVLYSFPAGTDGAGPSAGVIGDAAGNLYGTTTYGGSAGAGVVYKVDQTGHETVLYGFTGGADGSEPRAGVIVDSAGNLYGTTSQGGSGCAPFGCGVVYKLDPSGHETVLYSFTGGADGGFPSSGVIRDQAGNLYGTTVYGGIVTANCPSGCGVVYKLDPAGQLTVLHSFAGGAEPYSGVIRDSAGNLYGTTQYGGSANCPSGCGVVYKLDIAGQYTVLHTFTGGADGSYPTSGVIRDLAGNLYGTNTGPFVAQCGLVYKLDTAGQLTVLHTFTCGFSFGGSSGVILDAAGNLYGTAWGGAAPAGLVYELDAAGQYSVIYTFPGGADGSHPNAVIRDDTTGIFYGTTSSGGRAGNGTVFKIKP
jgi:uncharacterized repeat protein (TIGR03803 family)